MAHLVQESGEKSGRRFELGPICIIGRLKSCDLPIKDAKASRNNSKITLEKDSFLLEDLGSSNGTYLNDEKIRRAPLTHGDLVKVGNTEFRFHAPPPPEPHPPKPAPPQKPAPPPKPRAPAAPAVQDRELSPSDFAGMETPPDGIPSPAGLPVEDAPDEDVEELDLGGDDDAFPGPSTDVPTAPSPAPSTAPKPKPVFVSRVPLSRTPSKGRSKNLLFEDVSQRSAFFRSLLYLGVVLLMGFLVWLSFYLVRSAF